MKISFTLCLLFVLIGFGQLGLAQNSQPTKDKFAHWTDELDGLLFKYVAPRQTRNNIPTSLVNYKGFREDPKTSKLRKALENLPPYTQIKSETRQIAFLMNAYNFITIYIITKNPGLRQFNDLEKDGVNVWKQPAGKLCGELVTLDHIEHGILRKKFKEPRIHFGLVCAAISCPNLRNEAFRGPRLEQQLAEQVQKFLKNEKKGMRLEKKEGKNTLFLSQIFNWFKEDFGGKPKKWIIKGAYVAAKIPKDTRVDYLSYDWTLNALPGKN